MRHNKFSIVATITCMMKHVSCGGVVKPSDQVNRGPVGGFLVLYQVNAIAEPRWHAGNFKSA